MLNSDKYAISTTFYQVCSTTKVIREILIIVEPSGSLKSVGLNRSEDKPKSFQDMAKRDSLVSQYNVGDVTKDNCIEVTILCEYSGDSVGQKPLKSFEAVNESKKIRSDLLFDFDYGMGFRRSVGKSAGQTFYSLGRDPKPKDKSKKISPKHEFVDYLLNLKNGNLDLDVLYAYTRTFKENEEPELSIYDTVDIKYNGKL